MVDLRKAATSDSEVTRRALDDEEPPSPSSFDDELDAPDKMLSYRSNPAVTKLGLSKAVSHVTLIGLKAIPLPLMAADVDVLLLLLLLLLLLILLLLLLLLLMIL